MNGLVKLTETIRAKVSEHEFVASELLDLSKALGSIDINF